jgi:hypothetical protein
MPETIIYMVLGIFLFPRAMSQVAACSWVVDLQKKVQSLDYSFALSSVRWYKQRP